MTTWAFGALGAVAVLLLVFVGWVVSDVRRGRARARLTLVPQDSATAGDNAEWSVSAIAARIDRDRLAAIPAWPKADPDRVTASRALRPAGTPAPAAPEAALGVVLDFRPRPGSHPARQRPVDRRTASSRQPKDLVRLRLSRNESDRV